METYRELLAQRVELDKRIEETRNIELAAAISQVKSLIGEYRLTAADCGFKNSDSVAETVSEKPRATVAVKYRGPNGEVWTGRGKPPNWLTSLIAQGRLKDEFLVNKS